MTTQQHVAPAIGSAEQLWGHGAMLLFALLISVSFTLGDLAVPHIAPGPLTVARFALAVVVMGLIAAPALRRQHLQAPWRYVILGGLMAGYFVLMFEALDRTDPISTGAIFTLTPIMSAIFGWVLLRQVTTGSMAIALALAGCGALWVIFRGDVVALTSFNFGVGEQIFLVGCSLHAFYTPLVRLTRRDEPVLVYTFGMLCGGLSVTFAYSARETLALDWAELPPIAWAGIVYLGVATTAITALLVQFATLRLPSAKVMAYGYLVPTFVIVEEGLLGHGWVAATVWLGVAGTIAGLLILLREG
ncbi:MAG: DMT family transporter [Pseudomonadota bacterium]